MLTEIKLIARYSETDQMGIIHNSNYAVWYEAGRTDYFKKSGITYKEIEIRGIVLPLYEMKCQFKSPARYEDEILIRTKIEAFSQVRIIFLYEVINFSNNKILATGETMHAWTDRLLKPINLEKLAPDIYNSLKQTKEL